MAKIGRNDACPCGSGKKYKRCCLESATSVVTPASIADPTTRGDDLCECCVGELNEQADRALELILDGRLEDAEILCHRLIRDFPHQAEGIDLLSMICETRGELDQALHLLRHASNIAHADPAYDDETRLLMRERIKELEIHG